MTGKIAVFRDGDRWIVGPRQQASYSTTYGYGAFAIACEAKEIAASLQDATEEELADMLRPFWTNERFEDACDAGCFGEDWD